MRRRISAGVRRVLTGRLTGGLLAAVLVVPAVASGGPILSFTFSQTGYSGGASVTGSFTGTDVDNDGWLNSFVAGEILSYSMSFSGNATVQAFSHTAADFVISSGIGGLVYKLGTTFLGDDTTTPFEGIASGELGGGPPMPGSSPFAYRTGYGPTGMTSAFGFVEDNSFPPAILTDATLNWVVVTQVTPVPEPLAGPLLALGLAAAWTRRRRHIAR